ncbi:MAG: hypothetical protein AAF408_17460, partial [Pseudomonadota bacterium]
MSVNGVPQSVREHQIGAPATVVVPGATQLANCTFAGIAKPHKSCFMGSSNLTFAGKRPKNDKSSGSGVDRWRDHFKSSLGSAGRRRQC